MDTQFLWILYAIIVFLIFNKIKNVSFVSVAFIGLTAYSLPILSGWTSTVSLGVLTSFHVKTTEQGGLAMAMAWLGFLFSILFPGKEKVGRSEFFGDSNDYIIVKSCFIISIIMLFIIMSTSGIAFFLKSRDEAFQSPIIMIWRWVLLIGLMSSISSAKRYFSVYFYLMIFIVYLSGDRTLFVISFFSILLIYFYGHNVASVRSFFVLSSIFSMLFVFLVYAKPFYLFIKDPSSPFFESSSEELTIFDSFWRLEPFGIHYLLEAVIASDLRISFSDLIIPSLSQFLIFPSLFGVDSHHYNKILTEELFPGVTYGIAFNLWAQGYSFGGYIGVFVFGIMYGLVVRFLNFSLIFLRGVSLFCIIIFGVMVSVYGHRNSIENIISFGRQIFVSGLIIFVVVKIQGWVSKRFL